MLLSALLAFALTATPTTISIQVDAPFSEVQPLPSMKVEVDGVIAFDGPLKRQGNPMTHVWYAKGSAPLDARSRSFQLRVRIESRSFDETVTLEVARGRWVVIAQAKDGKLAVTQYTSAPLYR